MAQNVLREKFEVLSTELGAIHQLVATTANDLLNNSQEHTAFKLGQIADNIFNCLKMIQEINGLIEMPTEPSDDDGYSNDAVDEDIYDSDDENIYDSDNNPEQLYDDNVIDDEGEDE